MWSKPPYTITLFLNKYEQSVNSVYNQPYFTLVPCYIGKVDESLPCNIGHNKGRHCDNLFLVYIVE